MKYNYCIYIVLFVLLGTNQTIAQFVESAVEVGIDHTYVNPKLIGGGVAIFDMNNDGLQDIYVVGGEQNSALYINKGATFDENVAYLGIEDIDYYYFSESAIVAGDINNDGFDDLFICTHDEEKNYLMINNQDNTFYILDDSISGFSEIAWSVGASFGDINKDGYLDIFVVNYIEEVIINLDSLGNTAFMHDAFPNFLYLNNGDNTFKEVSEEYGIHKLGTSLATCFTDYDNDNDVDLYVANDFGAFILPNEFYENRYPVEVFTDESSSSGADIGLFGMGIAIGDYDNDLDLDYYVTNLGKNELLQNNGDKTFSLATNFAMVGDSAVGDGLAVGWGTGFMDYNNDGWLDLFVSNGFIPASHSINNPPLNPNVFFENNKDGTFATISREIGIQDNGFCRGAAYGDLDNDGDLDLIFVPVNKFGQTPTGVRPNVEVYYNETPNNNNWLKLKLQGTTSNYNGYGSHVLLHSSDYKTQLREVDGGSSHASSNSSIVHFGLHTATVDSVEIFWTNGIHQVIYNLEVNQQHLIIEGGLDTTITTDNHTIVQSEFRIYPNPTSQFVTINFNDQAKKWSKLQYQLVSLNGKLIQQKSIEKLPFTINLEEVGKQKLLLNIYNGDELIESKGINLQ